MTHCRLQRKELQDILYQSDYGKKTDIFNCYFVPGSQPPCCAVCSRAIGEHPNESDSSAQQATPQQAPPGYGASNDMWTGQPVDGQQWGGATQQPQMGVPVDAADPSPYPQATRVAIVALPAHPTAEGTPQGLVTGDTEDSVEVPYLLVMLMVAGTLFSLGVVLLVAFGASGMLVRAPVTCVGPTILLIVGFALLCPLNKTVVHFDRAKKEVRVKKVYLLQCCSTDFTLPFANLQDVTEEFTGVKVNHQPQYAITVTSDLGESYSFVVAKYLGVSDEVHEWRAYIARLKAM